MTVQAVHSISPISPRDHVTITIILIPILLKKYVVLVPSLLPCSSHMQAPSPHEESKTRSYELEIESADPAMKPIFALKTGLTQDLNDRQILGTPRCKTLTWRSNSAKLTIQHAKLDCTSMACRLVIMEATQPEELDASAVHLPLCMKRSGASSVRNDLDSKCAYMRSRYTWTFVIITVSACYRM
jgi:hypothetical protein